MSNNPFDRIRFVPMTGRYVADGLKHHADHTSLEEAMLWRDHLIQQKQETKSND